MSAHTPGPWSADDRPLGSLIFANGAKVWLASVDQYAPGIGPSAEERVANARLIAAAPDLLDAAREGLISAEGDVEARRAELAEYFEGEAQDALLPVLVARRDVIAAAIAKASPSPAKATTGDAE